MEQVSSAELYKFLTRPHIPKDTLQAGLKGQDAKLKNLDDDE